MRMRGPRAFIKQWGWLTLLCWCAAAGWSQTLERHTWLFGNSTSGVRFNRVDNTPTLITNKAVPFGTGGSSVATDPANANLLFYTDGNSVFDVTHTVMPNGTGLNANASGNQPTAVCAVPGQARKYFIFTNSASFTTGGTISYSIVDMDLFGTASFPSPPFGDLESKNTAVPGLASRAEGMIVVPHNNRTDFWLITQQVNSTAFSATLINAASYTGTFTTITSTAAALPTTVAHLAYQPTLQKLAVSPQDVSTDAIILNFNDASGIITFDQTILNSGVTASNSQSIYDIEWSNTGRFLYLSRHGDTGIAANVFQFDYLNPNVTLTPIVASPIFRSFGLQLAPDSTMYHLYQAASGGPFLLGRLDNPDTVAAGVRYNAAPFGASDFTSTQFPSFLAKDSIVLNVTFSASGTCQNSPTTFFSVVKPGADSLFWDFGDSEFGAGVSPIHTYAAAGSYNVALTAFYRGQSATATLPITINAFALQLQLTQDTTACRSEFPAPRGSSSPTQFSVQANISGGTPASIVWSNGDLGDTLTPDSAGYYYVVVTDASGCSAYAGVNVREYGLQDQTFNKWYFGDRAGIDFNQQPPVPLNESVMNAPEGCAIVCDRNGETIFYTDGVTVYDRNHTVLTNNLEGNPASTQSSLIVPVPDDETLYYLFTTQAINGTDSLIVKFSLFDLKANAGIGAVTVQNIAIFAKSTERITANGQWLIVHEYGNNTFRSYPISPLGIGNPTFSAIGSDHLLQFQSQGEGYMKLGPRDNLAVPLSNPGVSNHIELFHLNDTTGQITNFRDINLNEPNGQIYGVEFSPAGNKLFATIKVSSGSSHLFEYSIDSLEQTHFKQRLPQAAELGAIQIAPNGQLYVAVNNAGNNTSLGLISANDDTTQISSFTLNGFQLAAGTTSKLGLPNFVQQNSNALGGPGITVTGLCLGDSTRFSGASRDQIDEFNWAVFRNGVQIGPLTAQDQTAASFAMLLTQAGNYSVTLRLHNRCAPDTTMTESFAITNPPATPGGAAVLCSGPVTLDANASNAPGLTYVWSTGETTETIVVNDQRIVTATVIDALGCTSSGNFLVAENRPIVDLGPDLTVCEDNNTPALNAQNPGATYQWTINGVNAGTIQVQAVDVTVPGVFAYSVRVTDPVTTCFVVDTKTYTVNVSPAFTFSGVNPTSCGTPSGSVTLQLNASTPAGGPLYQYFISGGSVAQSAIDQSAPTTVTIPNVAAGTYSAIVTDQISGCTLSSSIGLTDATFTITPTVVDPCLVTYSVAIGGGVAPYDFTITNSGTGQILGPDLDRPTPYTTPALAAGLYVFQVTDNGGCIGTSNVTVAPNPAVPITLTPNLCNLTITASGATSYVWSSTPASGITGSTTNATVGLTPNAGQVTYTVVGSAAGFCPNTQTLDLNVGNITTPVLSQTDECSNSVLLSASPNGNFTYRWTRNGTLDLTLAGSQQILGLTNNGNTYSVQLIDPQTGCVAGPSATITAQVIGPVDASLSSTPPCQDAQPFTLTAASTATGVSYSWFLNNNPLTGVTTATTAQTQEGTYRVDISKAACVASVSLPIARAPLPVGALPNRVVICNDPDNVDPTTRSLDLDPGLFVQYEWSKNNLLLNNTQRVLTADSEGLYEVQLTNEFACVAIDETEVLNECLPKLNAPNAFRPGSSVAANRVFRVFSFFITDENFSVFIYNRWGELVFTTSDRDFTWNGGYNNNAGQPLPPGTYSYVIQYVSAFRPDKGVQEKRGGVALLR